MNKDWVTDRLVDCFETITGKGDADIDTYVEPEYRKQMAEEVSRAFPVLKLNLSYRLSTIQDYLAEVAKEVSKRRRILRVILEEAEKVSGRVYKRNELPLAEMVPSEAECASEREFKDKKFAHYLAYMRFMVRVQNRVGFWPQDDRLQRVQNVSEMVDVLYQR